MRTPLCTLVCLKRNARSSLLHILSVPWIALSSPFHLRRLASLHRPFVVPRRAESSIPRMRVIGQADQAERFAGAVRLEFRAAIKRHLACRRRSPPPSLPLHSSRSTITRDIIYIDAPRRSMSFRFFRRVTSRPSPPPTSSSPASSARVLCAKPGEHSFAEEAKVANYREASREGGLMRRSPMTDHIRSPPFCFCPPRAAMPAGYSTLASKSTDRCVNPTYYRCVRPCLCLSLSLSLSLSLCLPLSVPLLVPPSWDLSLSLSRSSLARFLFFLPPRIRRVSSFLSHGSRSIVRNGERDAPPPSFAER